MLKKGLILTGILIFVSACVITSPADIFESTPTICVECVQATLCAEDQTGDCGIVVPPLPGEPTFTETPVDYSGQIDPTAGAFLTQSAIEQLTNEPDRMDATAIAFLTLATVDTSTEVPTKTLTTIPSKTPFPPTSTPEPATPEPSATRTPGNWIYEVQPGSPKYGKNFTHPEKACGWSGIGGQIFGPNGAPQSDVVVVVTGQIKGEPVYVMSYSGLATQYGPFGYEVELPGAPVTTLGDLSIQLFDVQGNELTDAIPFDTFSNCSKNLIILNFVLKK